MAFGSDAQIENSEQTSALGLINIRSFHITMCLEATVFKEDDCQSPLSFLLLSSSLPSLTPPLLLPASPRLLRDERISGRRCPQRM